MSRLGLSGKSFIPLMSSFACAIPGVMATRVIENRRDRMVTMLIAPLDELLGPAARVCAVDYRLHSGRRPIWAAGFRCRDWCCLAMSSVGAVVAIPAAWLMKKTLFRSETPPFVMELPTYKIPVAPRGAAPGLRSRQGVCDAGRHADFRHGHRRLVRRLLSRRSSRAQRRAGRDPDARAQRPAGRSGAGRPN